MRLPVYKELSKREQFSREARRRALEYWSQKPTVDPHRIARTKELIEKYVPKMGRVVDIGAGERPFASDLALDIAPLEGCKEALFPYLDLSDGAFFCAICTDLIAELPQMLHRLALSELARILEPGGYLVCSTPLDQTTYDARECFEGLIETEFRIVARKLTYAPLLFSERIGQMIRGDGGIKHIILVAQKSGLH